MSRVEQVERNRDLVLAAARRVFLHRGYSGATLDAIAQEAGFSKGVVYSQFAGKADMFLALLERRIEARAESNARLAAGLAGLDGLGTLLLANARRSEEDAAWMRVLIEFRVLAAREPAVNERYARLHARTLDGFTEAIATVLERGGVEPAMPPRALAELIFVLDAGTVLERASGSTSLPVTALEDIVFRLVGRA
jgi:AcrR family transcriptional regulator